MLYFSLAYNFVLLLKKQDPKTEPGRKIVKYQSEVTRMKEWKL